MSGSAILLLTFLQLLGSAGSCRLQDCAVARKEGDIMLGGIFPLHEGVDDLVHRPVVDRFSCIGFQPRAMLNALSMIYTIEKINESPLLQRLTLGYEIYDSCSDALKAVQATLGLFPEISAAGNSSWLNGTDLVTSVKALIGESYSENSIAIGRILSGYFIPQLSMSSTADILSDGLRFPSFLRLIPRDFYQTQAIVQLVKTFGWNWVGIIAGDDDYGRSAFGSLINLFKESGICTAFSRIIPAYVEHPSVQETMRSVIADLKTSSAKVVILFANSPAVSYFLKECIQQNISRVWIGSDGWINSKGISSIEGIERAGTFLGFAIKGYLVPGYKDYLKNLYPLKDGETNELLEEYKTLRFGCTEEYRNYLNCLNSSSNNCSKNVAKHKSPLACQVEEKLAMAGDEYLVQNLEYGPVYATARAVTTVAQALRNLICQNGTCNKDLQFTPREFLAEIKQGSYNYSGDVFSFTTFGDVLAKYSFLNWKFTNGSAERMEIGEYETSNQQMNLNRSGLVWNNVDEKVPFSNCSQHCKPGQFKKHSIISCCYECIPCAKDTYSPAEDMTECLSCSSDEWSLSGSAQCENKTVQTLDWRDPFAEVLVSLASVGVLLVLVAGVLFVMNSQDAVVKAAGGNYAYVLMTSLLLSLGSVVLFVGEPNNVTCRIRQPLYGISFTISVSCILVKSILILMAFESAKKGQRVASFTCWSVVIIVVLTGAQVLICVLWLVLRPPYATSLDPTPQLRLLQCDEGSYVAFGIMLGYIGLLALTCFILAYRGRKLPEKYNEARSITFSMLVYMFVWVLFIPVYKNTSGIYLPAVQVVAILSSVYSVVACHLLPPCYSILFKRRRVERMERSNTLDFFRTKIRVFSNKNFGQRTPSITNNNNNRNNDVAAE